MMTEHSADQEALAIPDQPEQRLSLMNCLDRLSDELASLQGELDQMEITLGMDAKQTPGLNRAQPSPRGRVEQILTYVARLTATAIESRTRLGTIRGAVDRLLSYGN